MPNVGHFIKLISNGFYSFKENDREFYGVSLLDPIRIKCVSSDVSRNLNSCNNLDKKNTKKKKR